MNRIAFFAGLSVIALAAPVAAQELGLWQNHVGEGISYGEPGRGMRPDVAIVPADPVRALPVARRPVPPPAVRPTVADVAATAVERPALGAGPTDGPVGNFLSRPYDANIPLPHPDLAGMEGPARRSTKPHAFARGEHGGGIFGLTVPLPADRGAANSRNTRSGSAATSP